MSTPQIVPAALRAKSAAAYLSIGESTFWKWVKDGRLPAGTLLSARARVWPVDVLNGFLDRQASEQGGRK